MDGPRKSLQKPLSAHTTYTRDKSGSSVSTLLMVMARMTGRTFKVERGFESGQAPDVWLEILGLFLWPFFAGARSFFSVSRIVTELAPVLSYEKIAGWLYGPCRLPVEERREVGRLKKKSRDSPMVTGGDVQNGFRWIIKG